MNIHDDLVQGNIEAICVSRKKGIVKKEVKYAEFRIDHGIVGDAHAGKWHRQVSLLAKEDIDVMRIKIPRLANGAFAENIVTKGLELKYLSIGDRIKLGSSIILEVTQKGKECHTSCAIRNIVGDCIMPREGLFCQVIKGGRLLPGDSMSLLNWSFD
ncbi:MAG: MOSC domain-containing protein [Candidatus Neomarinimicrobiota bacterium]